MENWFMITMFGKDQLGVVAKLSAALCKSGCNLGDSSMARLGSNFTIMIMVQYAGSTDDLDEVNLNTMLNPMFVSMFIRVKERELLKK
jgi:glycine cleavage system transcriptional repressor